MFKISKYFFAFCQQFVHFISTYLHLKKRFPSASIDPRVCLHINNLNNIHIGENSYIGAFTVLMVMDDPIGQKSIASLSIGKNTYIGEGNDIRAGGGKIVIGNHVLISQHVSMVATGHLYKKEEFINLQPWTTIKCGIEIGDDVWIGANSVILPGVKVGTGAVVGGGSVVTKNVDSYTVVAGNPAKVIKQRI